MTKKEIKIQSTDEAIKQGGVKYVVLEEGERARKQRENKTINAKDLLNNCPPDKKQELIAFLKSQGIDVDKL